MTELLEQLQSTLGDKYHIERELAGGGMSRVFVAEEVVFGRQVVIKVLPEHLAAGLNVERFRREVNFVARLQHACIVPVLSAGASGGLPYYTMPFVEGTSLREKLATTQQLPVSEAIHILRDVLEALSYAHEHGLVHRDIKPGNVLLTRHHALVVDFGIAKALTASTKADATLTTPGVALGTPAYMAPEQATGDPTADHRADLYSLGALAYEMLAGRALFSVRSAHATIAAHIVEKPVPVDQLRPGIPAGLATLIMRSLEKEPSDRPQSAEEMLEILGSLATPSGGAAVAVSRGDNRSRVRIISASVVLLILLGSLAYAASRHNRAVPQLDPRRVMLAPFRNISGDSTLDQFGPIATEWIARGLIESGTAEVVPLTEPRTGSLSARGPREIESLRDGARKSGVGKIVHGSYFRRGASLVFQASIIDARSGGLLSNLAPSTGSDSDPMQAIEALRTRVTAVLTGGPGSEMRELSGSDAPPTFAAFREFLRGEDASDARDWVVAVGHYRRAAALDTSFLVPLVRAGYALINLEQCAQVDSVGVWLAPRRERLSSFEGYLLDGVLAYCNGDLGAAYRAGKRLVATAPKSTLAIYVAARFATHINHLHEALALLERLDPKTTHAEWYYNNLCLVLHGLGEHERELSVATIDHNLYPGNVFPLNNMARALGALGRMKDLDRVTSESALLSIQQSSAASPVMLTATLELAAHGYPTQAREMASRLVSYIEERPDELRGDLRRQAGLAQALCLAGECAKARPIVDRMLGAAPSNPLALRAQGITAAHAGDTAEAERVMAALGSSRDRYATGRIRLAQAQIASMLGRKNQAFNLLQQAIAAGIPFQEGFNDAEYALDALRDYAPFKALLSSKD